MLERPGPNHRHPMPEATTQPNDSRPEGLFFKGMFAAAYSLLIIASIRFVRDDIALLDNINIARIGLVALSSALWIGRSTIDRTLSLSVVTIGIVLSPYLLTDAIISYVDIFSLLIFSAAISKSREPEKFFVYTAYGSLALVGLIALMATVGVLPSTSFEWNGRVKESFGFTNPNTFFFYLFSSAFVFFIFRKSRGLIICGIFIAVMYLSVGSRTFALAYVFIATGYYFFKRINGGPVRFSLLLAIVSVTLIGMLTIYFPRAFSEWTLSTIGIDSDELFSSRLSLMEFELSYSTLNNAEFWLGGLKNVSDSMYAYFVNGFGLLLSTVFLLAMFHRTVGLSQRYGSAPLVFVLTFLMIGIVEVPFDGSALMSLLFIYALFYDQNAFVRWTDTTRTDPVRTANVP
jgi:hypothetical protein